MITLITTRSRKGKNPRESPMYFPLMLAHMHAQRIKEKSSALSARTNNSFQIFICKKKIKNIGADMAELMHQINIIIFQVFITRDWENFFFEYIFVLFILIKI